MTYVLMICVGYTAFFGACGQVRTVELPSLEICRQERDVMMKFKDVSWAACEAKKEQK